MNYKQEVERLVECNEYTWQEIFNLLTKKVVMNSKTGSTKAEKLIRNARIRERFHALQKELGGLTTVNRICQQIGKEEKLDASQVYRIVKSS